MDAASTENQKTANVDNGNGTVATAPTVVVISSNSAVDNVIAGLRGDGGSANSTTESQDYVDATDLTREQWIKILMLKLTNEALALKGKEPGQDDAQEYLPEFEVADDTYVETTESKNSLEREMVLKAFSESGIHAALSGGAQDIGFGFGGDFNWQNAEISQGTGIESTTAVHGFYNVSLRLKKFLKTS
ncbi:MAG: hypothetical protein Q9170_007222 [Blastenia crenularia]